MNDKTFWQNKLSVLFRTMVEELYSAILKKEIPFFWNCDHNLIGGLKPTLQKVYSDKLKDVLASIDANDVEKVVAYLLTPEELKMFKNSDFYQKQGENLTISECSSDSSMFNQLKMLNLELDEIDSQRDKDQAKDDKIQEFEVKLKQLEYRVNYLEDRLQRLENKEIANIVTGSSKNMSLADAKKIQVQYDYECE